MDFTHSYKIYKYLMIIPGYFFLFLHKNLHSLELSNGDTSIEGHNIEFHGQLIEI